jgi:hypothetical protein
MNPGGAIQWCKIQHPGTKISIQVITTRPTPQDFLFSASLWNGVPMESLTWSASHYDPSATVQLPLIIGRTVKCQWFWALMCSRFIFTRLIVLIDNKWWSHLHIHWHRDNQMIVFTGLMAVGWWSEFSQSNLVLYCCRIGGFRTNLSVINSTV